MKVQFNNIMQYIEGHQKEGTLVREGKGENGHGFFIEPTIFTNVSEDAKLIIEEIFGPVVVINIFRKEEEGLQKANNSEFGLYASVYTKDLD